jgi:hypothetical protein
MWAFNLLVAGAALTLGVVAIATDDVGSVTAPISPAVATPAVEGQSAPDSQSARSARLAHDTGACDLARPGLVVRC